MILVDSSVWIGYFRGSVTPKINKLDQLLASEPLAIGDLILTEVLQGFTNDRDFELARRRLITLHVVQLCGPDIAIQAARNFRALRKQGITVRKTIDTIIATCCIENGLQLLHDDRDFDCFAEHLSLQVVE